MTRAATTPPRGAEPDRRLSPDDLHLFNEGTHYRLYEKLGAHLVTESGKQGVRFAVWAPNAEHVSVVGNFNDWNTGATPLRPEGASGIWSGFVEGLRKHAVYKFHVRSRAHAGYAVNKADPFAFTAEIAPRTASVVTDLDYDWNDDEWMARRAGSDHRREPMSVYELHLGSWMHDEQSTDGPRSLSYRDVAPRLIEHLKRTGFTHVELMPVMEHPLYRSWGYQTTGYFAPTSRFGSPQDLMALIDQLHQAGIGVILDWVPSHFPSDEHALGYFDGTHLYEHADPRQGFHPDWKSLIFNYGRNEVRAFLISSAAFWLEKYHADGLRVDAVASMLYLDYSRKEGEWIPNRYGGRENIEAIDFLRQFNGAVHTAFPGAVTVAEESTAWPGVSRPTETGGLGFSAKWDMGWMHDTLAYLQRDPVYRRHHHDQITFRAIYQFSENYVLPLSHDEVVHGKGSLRRKMPGDDWQRFANLRLLFANQWTQPGKKLLFMGCELAPDNEWNQDHAVDWHLMDDPRHAGVMALVSELNRLHRELPALHEQDFDPAGFEWVEGGDADRSIIAYLRRGTGPRDVALVVLNFTPVVHDNIILGVPLGGTWREALNSDAAPFGGSGVGNLGAVNANPVPRHGRDWSLTLRLPPLAALVLTPEAPAEGGPAT